MSKCRDNTLSSPVEAPYSGVINFLRDMVAGGASAIGSKTVTAPIDRVKLLLQTQKVNTQLVNPYRGPVDCVLRVYKEQGLLSFWRGNAANVFRYFPNHAMNFAFKDKYKSFFVGSADKNSNFWRMFFGNLAAGGAAGATALFVGYPLDMARTRLATDVTDKMGVRKVTSTFGCIKSVYVSDGLLGVYKGFGVALFGVVIFKGLFMGGYDISKNIFGLDNKNEHGDKNHLAKRILIAQTITTVVGTACYPIDTIRRRLMMQTRTETGEYLYKNGWHCLRQILKNEGFTALFHGLSANLLRGVGGSILLVGYDEIKSILSIS